LVMGGKKIKKNSTEKEKGPKRANKTARGDKIQYVVLGK